MSELRKTNTDYAYFNTLTVAGWIDVFITEEYVEIIYTKYWSLAGRERTVSGHLGTLLSILPSLLIIYTFLAVRVSPIRVNRLLNGLEQLEMYALCQVVRASCTKQPCFAFGPFRCIRHFFNFGGKETIRLENLED